METRFDDLVKVHIDLPDHWRGSTGESLFAKPLGDDLYEIDNIPFYAYGLNYRDVVLARAESDDLKPSILQLVKASGHRTVRIIFFDTVKRERQDGIIESIEDLGVTAERMDHRFVAFDITPDGKYDLFIDRLKQLLNDNVLEFETCETRREGSFDFHE